MLSVEAQGASVAILSDGFILAGEGRCSEKEVIFLEPGQRVAGSYLSLSCLSL
jgi:hypothetical protein